MTQIILYKSDFKDKAFWADLIYLLTDSEKDLREVKKISLNVESHSFFTKRNEKVTEEKKRDILKKIEKVLNEDFESDSYLRDGLDNLIEKIDIKMPENINELSVFIADYLQSLGLEEREAYRKANEILDEVFDDIEIGILITDSLLKKIKMEEGV